MRSSERATSGAADRRPRSWWVSTASPGCRQRASSPPGRCRSTDSSPTGATGALAPTRASRWSSPRCQALAWWRHSPGSPRGSPARRCCCRARTPPWRPCRGIATELAAHGYVLALSEHSVVELLMDKVLFARYAADHDLPVPRTEALLDPSRRSGRRPPSIGYPCVIKPPYKSTSWLAHTSAKGVHGDRPAAPSSTCTTGSSTGRRSSSPRSGSPARSTSCTPATPSSAPVAGRSPRSSRARCASGHPTSAPVPRARSAATTRCSTPRSACSAVWATAAWPTWR